MSAGWRKTNITSASYCSTNKRNNNKKKHKMHTMLDNSIVVIQSEFFIFELTCVCPTFFFSEVAVKIQTLHLQYI